MKETETNLSARYYVAEATIWLLGCILLVAQSLGLAPNQPIPVLNVVLANNQYFARVVALLLIGSVLYMIIEWKQSSRAARGVLWSRVRLVGAECFAVVSLWISHPILSKDTQFESVSPAWYLGFTAIGFFLGTFTSVLIFSALMIRSREESKRLHLPLIPVAVRAQFLVCTPVIILLIPAYYILLLFSPLQIRGWAGVLVLVPFMIMILKELTSLLTARDEDGLRIPYAKRIAKFKEMHDLHDYSYLLPGRGDRYMEEFVMPKTCSPKETQEAIRSKFVQPDGAQPVYFRVQPQEKIQVLFYPKDGDPKNTAPPNHGVKLTKTDKNNGRLRVLVIPEDQDMGNRELEISTTLVEAYAEEYLSSHTNQANLALQKILSYALNQTVIKSMMDAARPLLHKAVIAGQIDTVRHLMQQDVDINEKAEFGWTALLAAVAQGYPEIVRLLLEVGANPDIGNVRGITPLMYGARYGNEDICQILLEYKAGVNLQDAYGATALIVAVRNGHQAIVELLLAAGADPTVKTRRGETAVEIAYACRQGKIAKILKTTKIQQTL